MLLSTQSTGNTVSAELPAAHIIVRSVKVEPIDQITDLLIGRLLERHKLRGQKVDVDLIKLGSRRTQNFLSIAG